MWAVWRQLMKRWSVELKSARDTRLCCPGTKHWLNWAPGNSDSLREQSRGYLGPLPPVHTLARLGSQLQHLRRLKEPHPQGQWRVRDGFVAIDPQKEGVPAQA